MKQTKTFLRRLASPLAFILLNRYAIFLVSMLSYSMLMKNLGGLGGYAILSEYFEIGLTVYLYFFFNSILRPSRWQALLAAVPILLAYLGQDIYYLMYGKVLRIIELNLIPELLAVLTPVYFVLIILFGLLPLLAFFYSINYRNFSRIILGILPLMMLGSSVEIIPQTYASTFEKVGNEIVLWSDSVSVENNGHFTMLLYREAERKIANLKTEIFRDRPKYDQETQQHADWIKSQGANRNVHLVVMESLMDPTLLRDAKFSSDPIHPSYHKLFGNKLGYSISPVFGGNTSQAEFEVLCGVPAFEELAGVEFNAFTGSPAYCLPGLLGKAGYRSIASNAYKPNFYNTIPAYKGIGFGETYFPREYAGSAESNTYLSTGDTTGEKYMFDGTLFQENLNFVANIIEERPSQPLFNYVLTIYGHMPHQINKEKRPQVLTLLGPYQDPHLEREANQFFYRTQAIAEYVNNLMKIDKNSLIILVSDHLPPLRYGPTTYQKLRYMDNREHSYYYNRIMIIENGKVKKLETIHHYDVPKLVLNYVTQGKYCHGDNCGFPGQSTIKADKVDLHNQYMNLMAHATE